MLQRRFSDSIIETKEPLSLKPGSAHIQTHTHSHTRTHTETGKVYGLRIWLYNQTESETHLVYQVIAGADAALAPTPGHSSPLCSAPLFSPLIVVVTLEIAVVVVVACAGVMRRRQCQIRRFQSAIGARATWEVASEVNG